MEIEFKKSTRKGKKFMIIFHDEGKRSKTIHFGSSANKDFTIYSKEDKKVAEERKRLYLIRHAPREDWTKPDNAGSMSRWILWNKPSVGASLKDYMRRFKLKLKK